jgi:hypothetical protein
MEDVILTARCEPLTKRALEIFIAEHGYSKKDVVEKAIRGFIAETYFERARAAIEKEAAANGSN